MQFPFAFLPIDVVCMFVKKTMCARFYSASPILCPSVTSSYILRTTRKSVWDFVLFFGCQHIYSWVFDKWHMLPCLMYISLCSLSFYGILQICPFCWPEFNEIWTNNKLYGTKAWFTQVLQHKKNETTLNLFTFPFQQGWSCINLLNPTLLWTK